MVSGPSRERPLQRPCRRCRGRPPSAPDDPATRRPRSLTATPARRRLAIPRRRCLLRRASSLRTPGGRMHLHRSSPIRQPRSPSTRSSSDPGHAAPSRCSQPNRTTPSRRPRGGTDAPSPTAPVASHGRRRAPQRHRRHGRRPGSPGDDDGSGRRRRAHRPRLLGCAHSRRRPTRRRGYGALLAVALRFAGGQTATRPCAEHRPERKPDHRPNLAEFHELRRPLRA